MIKSTFESISAGMRLKSFLETRMTMSHIYQPVMIRTILDGGGAATRRQIAAAIAAADLSQLEYYEQAVSRYPGPVLARHGIVTLANGIYSLTSAFNPKSSWERAELSAICNLRVADFIARRQDRLWANRATNVDPVPGSIRWQVISRAMGRCEACGISSADRALEVDHITPRSRGGTNDVWNLQALCSLCNLQKLDREPTDFHAAHALADVKHDDCALCSAIPYKSLENELAQIVQMPTGLVVAPKRHGATYIDLWQPEVNALRALEKTLSSVLRGASEMSTSMLTQGVSDVGHLSLILRPAAPREL